MTNKKNFDYKEFQITKKTAVAPDTFLFRLSGKLDFVPGQFVEVALDRFGQATFAPCSDTENKNDFELCVRGCGGTTKKMIELLPSDNLKIRGPYGNGWPTAKLLGQNLILIVGGLGLVPMRPLIFELLKYRKEFKKINLIFGTKSDHHLLFSDDLLAWKKKLTSVDVFVEHAGKDFWGEIGLITEPLEKLNISTKNTTALICGPEIMVPHCIEVLSKKNLPEKNIFVSFERRMECGIGICQHCNIGKFLVCRDGPVFRWDKIKDEIGK